MLSPSIRAVFFDAVGTLFHPEPAAPLVYAEVGRRHGSRLDIDTIASRFRSAFRHEDEIDCRHGLRTDEAREGERWRRIVATVLDDVADADACFKELFEHFSRPENWRLDAAAAVTLMNLARRRYVLGLASNYDRRLRRVVAGTPGLEAIQHLVISSEVGWRKPAPEFFAALCRAVELPPEQIAFVGDDRENDYEGARQAGLQAILLDDSPREADDGATRIRRLAKLCADVTNDFAGDELQITSEDPASPDAARLIVELSAEIGRIYGDDGSGAFTPDDVRVLGGAFVVARLNRRTVACGALRPMEPGVGEIKRMYVEPEHRGRRIARRVLAELERLACSFGYERLRLETGVRQVEAIRVYEASGYRRIPRYGKYTHQEDSVCFEKRLLRKEVL